MTEVTLLVPQHRRPSRTAGVARHCVLAFLLAGIAGTAAHAAAGGDPKYRVTDIGTLGGSGSIGLGFNEFGQVTGSSATAGDAAQHAFLWRNNGTRMVDIGALGIAGGWGSGYYVNSSGQVAGDVRTFDAASNQWGFLWRNDGRPAKNFGIATSVRGLNDSGQVVVNVDGRAAVWMNDGRPLQDIGTLGGVTALGSDINERGQVTGYSYQAYPNNRRYHAFLWRNNGTTMVDLGTLGGYQSFGDHINSSGQVAGHSEVHTGTAYHAFLWRNDGTPMVDLGTLGGFLSYPYAINDRGQVVGNSTMVRKLSSTRRAFAWMNDGRRMRNLGTLGGATSDAWDINAAGWVVGSAATASHGNHAFLWRNDGRGMRDLNSLIDPADPLKPFVVLSSADFINDAGDILASGYDTRGRGSGTYFLRGSSLGLDPRALAFGRQTVGTISASKAVTVQNRTTAAVPITSIALTGATPGQFVATNDCGGSLAAQASCTITVRFKPTTTGTKSAILAVNGGGGGLRTVTLAGTGT
jgi:probable HAF family extracellular repeat protein